MRVIVDRDALKRAVDDVSQVNDGSGLSVIAKDSGVLVVQMVGRGDTSSRTALEAVVAEPGEALLEAKSPLGGIIAAMPAGAVTLETEDHALAIRLGRINFRLATSASPPWPWPDYAAHGTTVEVEAKVLAAGLAHVVSAAGDKVNLSPSLMSVRMRLGELGIELTATDSYRLHQDRVPLLGEAPASMTGDMLLPLPFCRALAKMAKDPDEPVLRLVISPQGVEVTVDETSVAGRLINAQFPDVETLLRAHTPYGTLTFPREAAIAALRRIGLMADAVSHRITLAVENGVLSIASTDAERGSGLEEIADARWESEAGNEPYTLGVNWRFLSEAVSAVDAEDVSIHYGTQGRPVFIRSEDAFVALVMPLL